MRGHGFGGTKVLRVLEDGFKLTHSTSFSQCLADCRVQQAGVPFGAQVDDELSRFQIAGKRVGAEWNGVAANKIDHADLARVVIGGESHFEVRDFGSAGFE